MKSKVGKLDVDKLVPVPVDCSKLNDVVKNNAVKKDVYNAKIKDIEDKTPDTEDRIPDITHLAANTTLNAKISEIKNGILSITDLVANASLNGDTNVVKNKIPNITNLATTTALTVVKNKIPDHSKYITTPEFHKLTAETFTARLKQAKSSN